MGFQDETGTVRWRLRLRSPPDVVHRMLSTDGGRERFWAESAREHHGSIEFVFPNGTRWRGRILEDRAPERFSVEYLGGSIATFELAPDGHGGTDLALTDRPVKEEWRAEVIAGWVSVLMALKASVDFGVDLRNHDARRTWDQSYAEN